MLDILLSVAISHTPSLDVKSVSINPLTKCKIQGQYIIAQKYGGTDPHGPDPHGDDPHDEQHDRKLPANQERSNGKAPKDVYGDRYPNSQAPY